MLRFAIILALGYVIYLIYEKKRNQKYLASFKHVIHVNGIRGKTSVCRLIDANLRGAGYRVFTKTTGSTPIYIDTGGVEHLIKRFGPANIGEQRIMIKKAYQEKAEVLILECMAVDPVLQKASQEQIVQGDLNVITNVRHDHIFAMGETLDEIAASLSSTIPSNGMLFTADQPYFDYLSRLCKEKNTQAVLCTINETAKDENAAIAYEIGKYLEIGDADFSKNIQSYQEDFGASKCYDINGTPFLNLFSVNDPQSTRMLLERYVPDAGRPTFVYNNRRDRPDRLLLFARHFFDVVPYRKIVIIGENKRLAQRTFQKSGCLNVEIASDWNGIFQDKDNTLVVGIGNIKGKAYDIICDLEVDKRE